LGRKKDLRSTGIARNQQNFSLQPKGKHEFTNHSTTSEPKRKVRKKDRLTLKWTETNDRGDLIQEKLWCRKTGKGRAGTFKSRKSTNELKKRLALLPKVDQNSTSGERKELIFKKDEGQGVSTLPAYEEILASDMLTSNVIRCGEKEMCRNRGGKWNITE